MPDEIPIGGTNYYVKVGENTDLALQAATDAEASAAVALAASGPNFANTADGIDATDVNDTFAVDEGDTIAVYRHDAGPVATFLRRFPQDITASSGSSQVGYIADGAGAVATTVSGKLDESISVLGFMLPALASRIVKRTSTADDATATRAGILAAIAASNQRIIDFPNGVYNVNGTIQIQQDRVHLRGAGQFGVQFLQRTANVDTFKFGPPLSGSFMAGGFIEGMNVSHNSVVDASTTGAAVRFVQCNGYRLRDMSLNDSPEGLTVEGGQLGSLKTFNVFASTGAAKGAGSALLHFKEADRGGGVFQPCYTVQVEDFRLSASKLRDSCMRIASADGMTFTGGYIAFGNVSLVNVQFDRNNSYVAGCSFTNTYFDCVSTTTGTTNGIVIPDDAFTNSFVYDLKVGSGCILGNGSGWGLLCTKPEVMVLSAQDTRFVNFKTAAFVVENASGDLLDAMIDGCHFQNCGSVSSSVIRLANGRSVNISGNTFADNLNLQVQISGTWRTGSVTGNTNAQSTVADLNRSGATFGAPLVVMGNSSRNTSLVNSWVARGIITPEQYGAVGDGTADDTAAIQAAIDVALEGAIIQFNNRYRITNRLLVNRFGVILAGFNVARANSATNSINTNARIIADFTSGPAILISQGGVTVRGLTINGSSARRAAAISTGVQNSNSGILIEGADAPGTLIQSVVIEDVKITAQPADGILVEGDVTNLQINNTYIMDTGRHGIIATGGEIGGRTNKARPGIISIVQGKVYDNGGHALALGHPDGAGDVTYPYRVYVRNWENFRSATDAAHRFANAGVYLFGSEITLMNSAPCGTTTGNVPARPVAFIAGRSIEFINCRYIGFDTNAVIIGQIGGFTTEGVTLRGGTAFSSATVADFMTIAAGADGITVRNIDHTCTNPITATSFASTNSDVVLHDLVTNTTIHGNHTLDFRGSTLRYQAEGLLRTIASDAITVTIPGLYLVDTEALSASDNLTNITGAQYTGQEIIIRQANSGRTVTVVRGTGNIRLAGSTNFAFPDANTFLRLMWDGTNWREVGRAVSTG
jgi:hypothetical protein